VRRLSADQRRKRHDRVESLGGREALCRESDLPRAGHADDRQRVPVDPMFQERLLGARLQARRDRLVPAGHDESDPDPFRVEVSFEDPGHPASPPERSKV
jgi:hypothetical protein